MNHSFFPTSSIFQQPGFSNRSMFDIDSLFEQHTRRHRSNFLDLDTISIPISFQRPTYSSKSIRNENRPRTNIVEKPLFQYHDIEKPHTRHHELEKPLFMERTRQPYASFSNNTNSQNIEIEEPVQFKPNVSTTNHFETLENNGEEFPDPAALIERLKVYGMKQKTEIRGDGNCQFAAFADQYFGDIKHASSVRSQCVKWLSLNRDFVLTNGAKIEHFLQTDFFPTWDDYCEYMSTEGTWGDNVTLVALSELFQVKIVIISSIKLVKNQNPCTVIVPSKWKDNKVVYLSHLHELHYSSICPDDEFEVI